MNIDVIIPALDEEKAIFAVVNAVSQTPARRIYVVDNGSGDATAQRAAQAGALVLSEPQRGYGAACLRGIAALAPDCDVVVFVDGDGSDDPARLPQLVAPISAGTADLVVGSRTLGFAPRGTLTRQQRLGNAIASAWLRRRFGLAATDLGPFRAISTSALRALNMGDRDYGWTIEMQIKAARQGLRYAEIPVPTFPRQGISKVSGTFRGVVGATYKILGLLAYHDVRDGLSTLWQKSRAAGKDDH